MDERVFQKLGFDKLRERLCGLTLSEPGAALARALQPSAEREAVEALLAETAEAEHLSLAAAAYPMSGFDDLKAELSRLRAGAALVIAALAADGTSTIEDAHYIERGYEDIIGKFAALGARIRRVETQEPVHESAAG